MGSSGSEGCGSGESARNETTRTRFSGGEIPDRIPRWGMRVYSINHLLRAVDASCQGYCVSLPVRSAPGTYSNNQSSRVWPAARVPTRLSHFRVDLWRIMRDGTISHCGFARTQKMGMGGLKPFARESRRESQEHNVPLELVDHSFLGFRGHVMLSAQATAYSHKLLG